MEVSCTSGTANIKRKDLGKVSDTTRVDLVSNPSLNQVDIVRIVIPIEGRPIGG